MSILRPLLLCLLILVGGHVHAQGRKDLEKKREALDKQIKTTTALIEQARALDMDKVRAEMAESPPDA